MQSTRKLYIAKENDKCFGVSVAPVRDCMSIWMRQTRDGLARAVTGGSSEAYDVRGALTGVTLRDTCEWRKRRKVDALTGTGKGTWGRGNLLGRRREHQRRAMVRKGCVRSNLVALSLRMHGSGHGHSTETIRVGGRQSVARHVQAHGPRRTRQRFQARSDSGPHYGYSHGVGRMAGGGWSSGDADHPRLSQSSHSKGRA